jgi:hypothetical protein
MALSEYRLVLGVSRIEVDEMTVRSVPALEDADAKPLEKPSGQDLSQRTVNEANRSLRAGTGRDGVLQVSWTV